MWCFLGSKIPLRLRNRAVHLLLKKKLNWHTGSRHRESKGSPEGPLPTSASDSKQRMASWTGTLRNEVVVAEDQMGLGSDHPWVENISKSLRKKQVFKDVILRHKELSTCFLGAQIRSLQHHDCGGHVSAPAGMLYCMQELCKSNKTSHSERSCVEGKRVFVHMDKHWGNQEKLNTWHLFRGMRYIAVPPKMLGMAGVYNLVILACLMSQALTLFPIIYVSLIPNLNLEH